MEPITNAPSSSENPQITLNTAIVKQRAIDTTRIVSSLSCPRSFVISVGSMYTPTTNQIMRKKNSLPIEKRSSDPFTSPIAIEERSTSMSTAKRSSIMRTASTSVANFLCLSPRSERAFMIIVVDDIDIMPPRNMRFIMSSPST